MRKIILILLTFLSITSAYSQSKVIKEAEKCEGCATAEQIRHIEKLQVELDKLVDRIPPINNDVTTDLELLKKHLEKNEQALNYIYSNQLSAKCTKLKQLQGKANLPATCNIERRIELLENMNERLVVKIESIVNPKQTEAGKQESARINSHVITMSELENELEMLDDEFKTNSTKKAKTNNKSLDDILAELDNETNSSESDFLESLDENTDAKAFTINTKDGKQGVIDNNGNVLIPYGDWRIMEYKMGIAQVYVELESLWDCDCYSEYLEDRVNFRGTPVALIWKSGYVDKTGKFIDDPKIEFSTDCTINLRLSLWSSSMTESEIERAKERQRKEITLAEKKCQTNAESWKEEMLTKYEKP
ncbi:hypothetical protein [Patiriisocius hiemis]|uniref:Uncharacterized protein n=1 Tax=Patiriisocius hiemis TaxID=3075604 RepID=A0ABU2Y8W8_9FLAO|nr:hypothetical protein [Constantimarinum sp. W242]MDT0554613.1 hypothetical protein [Constantimarinum sp. W242]